ncbi:hypothetical protein OIO90_003091 [Microbotryomycetes sp. JL221]|nr:hypothetical protein OIO90_003091 [Microbotryomycetes sp. JL221]
MSHYDTLQIPIHASNEHIRAAYLRLANLYHPDRAPRQLQREYEVKFHAVADAFRTLSDPSLKSSYDGELGQLVLARARPALSMQVGTLSHPGPTASPSLKARPAVWSRPNIYGSPGYSPKHTTNRLASPLDPLSLLLSEVVGPQASPLLRNVRFGTEWTLPGSYSEPLPQDHTDVASPSLQPVRPVHVSFSQPTQHERPFTSSAWAQGVDMEALRHGRPNRVGATYNQGERLENGDVLIRSGRHDLENLANGAAR